MAEGKLTVRLEIFPEKERFLFKLGINLFIPCLTMKLSSPIEETAKIKSSELFIKEVSGILNSSSSSETIISLKIKDGPELLSKEILASKCSKSNKSIPTLNFPSSPTSLLFIKDIQSSVSKSPKVVQK